MFVFMFSFRCRDKFVPVFTVFINL